MVVAIFTLLTVPLRCFMFGIIYTLVSLSVVASKFASCQLLLLYMAAPFLIAYITQFYFHKCHKICKIAENFVP